MLIKTTLAVIGLAASSYAFAGAMGPVCTPGNVTVPCEANRWDLGLQALYLQSAYGVNKAYEKVAAPASSTVTQFNEVKNNWNWGYQAEGSYHFNTGNDVTIEWTHYSSDSSQFGLSGFMPTLLPFGNPFVTSGFNVINQNRFDQVNLVMGQHVDVGLVKKMRFYGGLQYSNIQANATNFYQVAPLVPIFTSLSLFDDTDFKGIGPVLGIDYSYDITNALSVTANGEGSVLYGTGRYNSGYVGAPGGLVVISNYGAKKLTVPTIEAKLGLNYAYNMAQGVMNFEGGYQVINYFNVLQTQFLQNLANPLVSTNYGLYGPYFGVKYLGNA